MGLRTGVPRLMGDNAFPQRPHMGGVPSLTYLFVGLATRRDRCAHDVLHAGLSRRRPLLNRVGAWTGIPISRSTSSEPHPHTAEIRHSPSETRSSASLCSLPGGSSRWFIVQHTIIYCRFRKRPDGITGVRGGGDMERSQSSPMGERLRALTVT